jgi:hypothetical protein
MTALKTSMVSLALCSLFASSLVRADDCSDSLVAESCACRSQVGKNPAQLPASSARSTSDRQAKGRKKASPNVAQRVKKLTAIVDTQSTAR